MPSPMEQHLQPTAFFIRGASPLTRLAFYAIVSIVLMGVDARLHYLAEIRQGISVALHPLEVAARAPVDAYNYISEYIHTQTTLVAENRALREKALQDSENLQRFNTLQAENAHMRSLLNATPTLPQPARLGEIIHSGRDPFSRKIIVNLGARHGITPGQAVIDEWGVVGQVTAVYPLSSEVTLVSDNDLAVPVQVERSGLRAITGKNGNNNSIGLPFLPVNVDIQPGDKLVTSGIDGVYPAGLAVCKVAAIDRKSDAPFARIDCTPAAGIGIHRQVLLIPPAENMPPLLVPPKPADKTAAKSKPGKKPHAPRKP